MDLFSFLSNISLPPFALPPFALPVGLAFIMFAMGLTLQWGDFRPLLTHPKAIFTGLFVQLILLPLTAFALLQLMPLAPAFAVGVLVLAACPGGITSNLLTHLARGDVALSVSLSAISSLLGMISVPLVTNFALKHYMAAQGAVDLPVGRMVMAVFAVSTLPVLLGMTINHLAPRLAELFEALARPLSVAVFVLIVLAAFATSWQMMIANIATIGPLVLALNGGIMLAGWLLAHSLSLPRPQAVAISLEGGLQNGALGIFVAMSLLHNSQIMVASITYALVMNLTAAALIFWRLQKSKALAE